MEIMFYLNQSNLYQISSMKKILLLSILLIGCAQPNKTNNGVGNSKWKNYIKIDYINLNTETLTRVSCSDFYSMNDIHNNIINNKDSISQFIDLKKNFVSLNLPNGIDARGNLILHLENKSDTICFDAFGRFQLKEKVYESQKL